MQFDDFQDPHRTAQQLKGFRVYAPYSEQFAAFCVIDILKIYDQDRDVVDELPLVVIYDWVSNHRPSMAELAHAPTIVFRDNYNFPDNYVDYPIYNCLCGEAPGKKDVTRNKLVYIGQTYRFREEGFIPTYRNHPKMWSALQCVLMNSRLYLEDSLAHKAAFP